jgi:hypothetical protein
MRALSALVVITSAGFVALAALAGVHPQPSAPESVDFNRDVRPILSGHCFKCHGPDDKQRQAGLRLDSREAAVGLLRSGKRAIVAHKPEQSELVHRILAPGPAQMPPVTANKPLTDRDKWILRKWVADGAKYEQHWAFVAPIRAPLRKVKLASWPRNPIDYFTLARMEAAGLKPSPEADRYTLIRRLYLDLIGIPPTPEQADAFVKDSRPDAYEKLVDSLLASPHYGERWARRWLDLARYADTNGFEKDRPRSIWPYRDWVINALNADMPFDQFTIKQLAGDMLPNATIDDRIATGFHRNTMLNEEGGVDPLEYRFYNMVDRTNVTGTTWLGLTVGCAECHTHKFDPITQREYYSLMACMDNTEEPEIEIPKPDIAARRQKIEAEIAAREANLADRFPPLRRAEWHAPDLVKLVSASAESGATLSQQPDGSLLVTGTNPESDTYTVVLETAAADTSAIRIEALADDSLGGHGPGRTPHGNFVLTGVTATAALPDGSEVPVRLTNPEADFSQDGFSASATLDSNQKTGWAVAGNDTLGKNHAITYWLEKSPGIAGPARWTFKLAQSYGGHHTLGRFRIRLGRAGGESITGPDHLKQQFGAWLAAQEKRPTKWTVVRPVKAVSNLPLLTLQDDDSIFVSGDEAKRDVYDLDFKTGLRGISAVRLEVLPDDRLPNHGPGRVFYEGANGDFFLSEATVTADGKPAKIGRATVSFGSDPQAMIDGDPLSAWSINGGQGKPHTAVFSLAKPLESGDFSLKLLFERYHAADLGRFRIAVSADASPSEAGLPPDVESALAIPAVNRTPAQSGRLLAYYVTVAPELASERESIRKLGESEPAFPTTLAMRERPANNPRATFVHHRGEYLQPTDRVTPGTLSILPPPPAGQSLNRLTFAKWLVSPSNPLTARVTVNRQWQAFFGQGIVRTLQDFGYTGDPPTHPELLDWLASAFSAKDEGGRMKDEGVTGSGNSAVARAAKAAATYSKADLRQLDSGASSFILHPSSFNMGWSMKQLDRLIVTSATYRQSSRVAAVVRAKDPENRLLARGPRFRLDAELLRDSALAECGILAPKIGGPSVFPPQPAGVTSEGTYGPLTWKVSEGEDRYRRGLYTFAKRTAPYAMFTTFDGPTGEAICPRREVSNTPLQALTMLNDQVLVEAAQALGRMVATRPGTTEDRAAYLFRRCVTRPPTASELAKLVKFYATQKQRFASKELDAATVAGQGGSDLVDLAAWTALARSVLNVDEAIVKR